MKKRILIFIITSASILYSCRNNESSADSSQSHTVNSHASSIVNTGKSSEEAYDMLHVVFEGKPEPETIKKLMSAVMAKYNIEENYENLNRCGSALLGMKKSSAVGITEMEILKHMYQHGDPNQSFPSQAAISTTILEQTK